MFFQQLSYLTYDVPAKTAPKSLLHKFAKSSSKHHYNTPLSAKESFSVKFSITDKKKSFTRIGESIWNLLYLPPDVILVYFQITKSLYLNLECFHSRGQHLCKFIGTKESVCIREEFNSRRMSLQDQHGPRFIVLEDQYGRRDVM